MVTKNAVSILLQGTAEDQPVRHLAALIGKARESSTRQQAKQAETAAQ